MNKYVMLLLLNTLSYFLLTCDMRSVAFAKIIPAVSLNLVIAALSFTILKTLQNIDGWRGLLAYTFGGAIGTYLGIIGTVKVFGQ